jgi:MSHA biogenesis protein MshP
MRALATKSRGFALMLAVFLIVTLAVVGVYLVTISTGQSAAVSQDEQAGRAYQAARAGLEYAAFRLVQPPTATTACADVAGTLALPQVGGGFVVTLTCTESSEAEGERTGPNEVRLFQVTATGCNSGATCVPLASPAPTYVERQLHLTLAR